MDRDYFIEGAYCRLFNGESIINLSLSYGADGTGDYVFTNVTCDSGDPNTAFIYHTIDISIETFNMLIEAIGKYPATMVQNTGHYGPLTSMDVKKLANKEPSKCIIVQRTDKMAFHADLDELLINDLKLRMSSDANNNSDVENTHNDNTNEELTGNSSNDSSIFVGSHEAFDKLNTLIGLSTVKQQVKDFINTAKYSKKRKEHGLKGISFSYHSLFEGNPGTGKTTVARLVGRIMYEEGILPEYKFKEVDRSGLVAGYMGQTAKRTMKVLKEATGGVLFIDEAYSLVNDKQDSYGREALDTIMKYMEDHRDNLMVIFAGYTTDIEKLLKENQGMKSRVPNIFDFEDYNIDEIVEIGELDLKQQQFSFDNDETKAFYKQVISNLYMKQADGSNGRWVRDQNQKLIKVISSIENHSFSEIFKSDIEKAFG